MSRTRIVAGGLVPALVLCLVTPSSAQDPQRARDDRPTIVQRGAQVFDADTLREIIAEGGPDGIVQIHQSTFDELAKAVLPIDLDIPAPAPFNIPRCDEIARIDLKTLNFYIFYDWIAAISTGSGRWCGIRFTVTVSAPANVHHNATAGEVRLSVGSGTARVTVDIPDWADWAPGVPDKFDLSFTVNLTGSLGAIPAIPIEAAEFTLETARGSRTLHLVGHNVLVLKQTGYIELRGNVALR